MYAAIKAIDPTRPIHYESRNPPYVHGLSSFDIISTMHPTVDAILDLIQRDETRPGQPFLPDEWVLPRRAELRLRFKF